MPRELKGRISRIANIKVLVGESSEKWKQHERIHLTESKLNSKIRHSGRLELLSGWHAFLLYDLDASVCNGVWTEDFGVVCGFDVEDAYGHCAWKPMRALWSCGAIEADSMPCVSSGTKHILNTCNFHFFVMLLFFQNLCSVLKPALAFAMRALMSLCVCWCLL